MTLVFQKKWTSCGKGNGAAVLRLPKINSSALSRLVSGENAIGFVVILERYYGLAPAGWMPREWGLVRMLAMLMRAQVVVEFAE